MEFVYFDNYLSGLLLQINHHYFWNIFIRFWLLVPIAHPISFSSQKLRVPVYFTDACLYSCAWGYRVVARLGLGVDAYEPESGLILDSIECTGQTAPVLNPFRSPVRMSSAGVQWGWFRNSFIFSPFCSSEICSLEEPSHLWMQLASLKM